MCAKKKNGNGKTLPNIMELKLTSLTAPWSSQRVDEVFTMQCNFTLKTLNTNLMYAIEFRKF